MSPSVPAFPSLHQAFTTWAVPRAVLVLLAGLGCGLTGCGKPDADRGGLPQRATPAASREAPAVATVRAPLAQTPPGAPSLLMARGSNGRVRLHWDAVPGASTYDVYAASSLEMPEAAALRSGIVGTRVVVDGLANGTEVRFVVRAVNAAGRGAPSNVASATPGVAPRIPLAIRALELAQTHVLPAQGRRWTLNPRGGVAREESLHFTGGRRALVLVSIDPADVEQPMVEGWVEGARLGAVPLDPPEQLPPTEAGGPPYATDRYSAPIPAEWMRPGLQLRVTATDDAPSALQPVEVGADLPLTLRILPFYLFGADDADRPYARTAKPDAATVREMYEKWPVATLSVDTHPAQRAAWPYLVIPPTGTAPATVITQADAPAGQGLAQRRTVLDLLERLRDANGDGPLAVQYYAPLIARDAAGHYRSPGGGLGAVGGDAGTGDDAYRRIFIHEQGHAMGLPHADEAFEVGEFPYRGGSLEGSHWGYDAARREFLPPFAPAGTDESAACAMTSVSALPRVRDARERCVRQDPMQSRVDDDPAGYRFSPFSDFNVALMQRHFEGRTTRTRSGARTYEGGYVVADPSFPSGFRRWDALDRRWVNVSPATRDHALRGFNGGLPVQRNVAVFAVALTLSRAPIPGATQIYPPLRFTGNLIRSIDPTDAAQRALVRHPRATPAGAGEGRWFCSFSGCDYTLRVHYANGNLRHVLLQGAFRNADYPGGGHPTLGDFIPESADPNLAASFRTYVVNVPGDAPLERIELLDTPMAWDVGVPARATVLARWPG